MDTTAQFLYFSSELIHFLLVGSLGVVALSDLREEVGSTPLKLFMSELPVFGFTIHSGVAQSEWIRLDLAKAIKVLESEAIVQRIKEQM
jgi:hypothetical protein